MDDQGLRFKCAKCGQEHDLGQLAFGAEVPEPWNRASDAERSRSQLTLDQCVLEAADGRHFFVRACLAIPIRDTHRDFVWGVWVSLSEANFTEMSANWEEPDRIEMGPYFGWLCTSVPGYPDTLLLKTRVHQRPIGLRPLVELEPTDHPLATQQREGIPLAELREHVAQLLHGW